jgi:hypothetical protein
VVKYSSFQAGSNTTSNRIRSLRIAGAANTRSTSFAGCEVKNTIILSSANANTMQGMELYEIANTRVHNNNCDISATVAATESGRCIAMDGQDHSGGNMKGTRVDHNNFILGDNRAIRCRECGGTIDNNIFPRAATAQYGVIHNGDGDFRNDTESMEVYNNTFIAGTGNVIFSRGTSGTGFYVHDNTVTCSTCTLGPLHYEQHSSQSADAISDARLHEHRRCDYRLRRKLHGRLRH